MLTRKVFVSKFVLNPIRRMMTTISVILAFLVASAWPYFIWIHANYFHLFATTWKNRILASVLMGISIVICIATAVVFSIKNFLKPSEHVCCPSLGRVNEIDDIDDEEKIPTAEM